MKRAKAVFLDRDGTIVSESTPIRTVRQMGDAEIHPDCVNWLRRFQQDGYLLIIVTNQSQVAHGNMTEMEMSRIHHTLHARLMAMGVEIKRIKACIHHPDEGCECRKPAPGLLKQMADRYDINLNKSIMIGNSLSDIQAGQSAGCKAYLVKGHRHWADLDLTEPYPLLSCITREAEHETE
jgi:D-glycero-D-manno-heptose 1,7-bisphosphate phosphatase